MIPEVRMKKEELKAPRAARVTSRKKTSRRRRRLPRSGPRLENTANQLPRVADVEQPVLVDDLGGDRLAPAMGLDDLENLVREAGGAFHRGAQLPRDDRLQSVLAPIDGGQDHVLAPANARRLGGLNGVGGPLVVWGG